MKGGDNMNKKRLFNRSITRYYPSFVDITIRSFDVKEKPPNLSIRLGGYQYNIGNTQHGILNVPFFLIYAISIAKYIISWNR